MSHHGETLKTHFISFRKFLSYDIVDQLQSMMHLKTSKTCMRRFEVLTFIDSKIKHQDYIFKYTRIRFRHIHIEYFIDDLQMMLFLLPTGLFAWKSMQPRFLHRHSVGRNDDAGKHPTHSDMRGANRLVFTLPNNERWRRWWEKGFPHLLKRCEFFFHVKTTSTHNDTLFVYII